MLGWIMLKRLSSQFWTGLKCERLPKATFARYMYLIYETRRLAQIQVADTLLTDWESFTVMAQVSMATSMVRLTLQQMMEMF